MIIYTYSQNEVDAKIAAADLAAHFKRHQFLVLSHGLTKCIGDYQALGEMLVVLLRKNHNYFSFDTMVRRLRANYPHLPIICRIETVEARKYYGQEKEPDLKMVVTNTSTPISPYWRHYFDHANSLVGL